MVEGARLCRAGCAGLDERALSQQPAHLACAAAEDRPVDAATAKRGALRTTTRPGQNDLGHIDREIGDWRRFNNRRQIASYTGLCPGEYSSGQKRLQGCVTKHGNPRLRAALVELAWRMVRFQPHYRAVRKWKERLAKGTLTTGAARKKAIVALARQLAVDLWRVRTGRLTPEQLGLAI